MKHIIFLSFMFVFLINAIHSQESLPDKTQSNKYLLGGNISFNSTKIYDDTQYNSIDLESLTFKIEPKFGIMVSRKITIGFKTGFTYMKNSPYNYYKEEGKYAECTVNGKLLSFAPFIRFQNTITGKLHFYIDTEFGYEFSSNLRRSGRYYSYYEVTDYNEYYGKIAGGVILNITENFGVEAQIIGFEYIAHFIKGNSKPFSEFKTEFIFANPNLGLVFYL